MNEPLVSVVVTTHHEPCWMVMQCLESIVNQTYKNLEIIFVDDCSEATGVHECLSVYPDERLNYIRLTHNVGFVGAKNISINAATGEYMMILDADFVLNIHYIESAMDILLNPDNNAFMCLGVMTVQDVHAPDKYYNHSIVPAVVYGDKSLPFKALAFIVKSDIIKHFGSYDFKSHISDADLYLKILKYGTLTKHQYVYLMFSVPLDPLIQTLSHGAAFIFEYALSNRFSVNPQIELQDGWGNIQTILNDHNIGGCAGEITKYIIDQYHTNDKIIESL